MSENIARMQINQSNHKQNPQLNPSTNSNNTSLHQMPSDTRENKEVFNSTLENVKTEIIDIVLIFLPKYEKELVKEVKANLKENDDIDLVELVKSLKGLGFSAAVDRNMISYHSQSNDMYVYCGNDPLPLGTVIPAREVTKQGEKAQVTIRIRQAVHSFQMMGDTMMIEPDAIKVEGSDGPGHPTKQKRTKERKIGQILDKVYTWRKYYSGFTDPQSGQTIKMSLEDAAQKVGISKKSLDDYLLQIRFGKKIRVQL